MSEVYILKNQNNEFLEKSGEWVNIHETKSLYRTLHKDEALNQKVEFSVKRPELRISVIPAQSEPNGKVTVNDDIFDTTHPTIAETQQETEAETTSPNDMALEDSNDQPLFQQKGDSGRSNVEESQTEENNIADENEGYSPPQAELL